MLVVISSSVQQPSMLKLLAHKTRPKMILTFSVSTRVSSATLPVRFQKPKLITKCGIHW